MTNQAWECPRCKRMNAPFNPACFCSSDTKLTENEQRTLDALKKPKYDFGQTMDYITNGRCSNCNGYHGMWNGRPVQCVDLQNGFCHGLPIFKVTS